MIEVITRGPMTNTSHTGAPGAATPNPAQNGPNHKPTWVRLQGVPISKWVGQVGVRS